MTRNKIKHLKNIELIINNENRMFQLKIGEYVLNCENAAIYSEDLYKNIEYLKPIKNKNTEMLFLQLKIPLIDGLTVTIIDENNILDSESHQKKEGASDEDNR
ncbi:MAG: hypothetical protein WC748_09775 [Legionellales bacterium]|jgi:hypothetical protein